MKKHKTKYPIKKDGEWSRPVMSNYKLECCDCGLIHNVDFVVIDEETGEIVNDYVVMLRAYRINKKKK